MNRSVGTRLVGAILALGTTALAIFFLLFMLNEGGRGLGPVCQGCAVAWTLVLPLVTLLGGAAIFFALLRGPVGKAIGRMLDSHDLRDELDDARFRQLEDRLADSELDRQHVAELEERLDFTERLLARPIEPEHLPMHRTPV